MRTITIVSIGSIIATPIAVPEPCSPRPGRSVRRRVRVSRGGRTAAGASALPGLAAESRRGDVVEGAASQGADFRSAEGRRDGAAEHQGPHLAPVFFHGHRRRAGLNDRTGGGYQGELKRSDKQALCRP